MRHEQLDVRELTAETLRDTAGNTLAVSALLALAPGEILYASEGKSKVLSELAAETAFDKAFSIPADSIQVGDVLVLEGAVKTLDVNGTDDHTYKVKAAGELDLVTITKSSPADDDIALFRVEFVFNAAGETGAAVVVAHATDLAASGSLVWAAPTVVDLGPLDCRDPVPITVTAEHATSHAENQSRLEYLVVRRR